MMMNKWIWFDMDGTIADLYGVEGWLNDLTQLNPRPYAKAKPMYDMETLVALLLHLKSAGFRIGVISWLAKSPDEVYARSVTFAKTEWLARYGLLAILDEVLIVPYGQNKAETCKPFGSGILIDDEEPNRNKWDLGDTINANENIIEILKTLLTSATEVV